MSDGWQARRTQWPWREFLTTEEAATVADAERQSAVAKQKLAEATAILNPIRNRAIHRAKYEMLRLARPAVPSNPKEPLP